VSGGIGPAGLRAEYMLADKFGMGVDFIYNSLSTSYSIDSISNTGIVVASYDAKLSMQRFRVQMRMNYHFVENDNLDAWFIGLTSNLVIGVYIGFDEPTTLGKFETGAKAALPIWKEVMRSGIKKYGESDFKSSSGVINVLVNKETGELAKNASSNTFLETFIEGTEPGSSKINSHLNEQKSDQIDTQQILEDGSYYDNQ